MQANGGSAGVDGVTIAKIVAREDGAKQLVEQLHTELRTKTYITGICGGARSAT